MAAISWCKHNKKGIRLVEPNPNISNTYIEQAKSNLVEMAKVIPTWKTIMAYYACYDALYAILQSVGVKCEIHDCSIALMRLFEHFTDEDINFMQFMKSNRIDVQYYLKKPMPFNDLTVKLFVDKCISIIDHLDEKKINKIRETIQNA